MTSQAMIRRIFEHLRWANARLCAACRPLTDAQLNRQFDIGQGTVLATLTHLYAAEFVWLEAVEGNPSPVSPFDVRFGSVASLETAWAALSPRWERLIDALTDTDLDRLVVKKSTSSYAGTLLSTSLADVLLHVATHARYTAAQLKNMLRQLGVTDLPDVMFITMSREQV